MYIAGNVGKEFSNWVIKNYWVKITKLKARQFKLNACGPMWRWPWVFRLL